MGKKDQANLPRRCQPARAQPDGPGRAVGDPRDGPVVRAGPAPALAGSDGIYVSGDCRNRGARRRARIWQVPGWPRRRTGAAAARGMLHDIVRLVRSKLILASKEKSQELEAKKYDGSQDPRIRNQA